MICGSSSLISALNSSLSNRIFFSQHLPLSLATAAAPEILAIAGEISPRTVTTSRQLHSSSKFRSGTSAVQQGKCPSVQDVATAGGRFEARFNNQLVWSNEWSRERSRIGSRIVSQFATVKSDVATDFRVWKAFSRTFASEADKMQETSSTAEVSDSQKYLVGGKYCVLLAGHAPDYSQRLYGGYGQMCVKLLEDPRDTWDIYPVVDGQFPGEEVLEKYDGFVITGSKHDAHGTEDWIVKLCALVQSVYEKKQNTLGICFGHQVLSRALGGKTGRARDVGWELGLRKVQTTDALASKVYAVGVPSTFRILESHQDQVQEIPPGAELLGFSDRTGIEIFAVGDHTLGIQGHPEFTEDVVSDLIDSRLANQMLTEEEAKAARATLKAGQADQEALVRLCKGFLKRRKI